MPTKERKEPNFKIKKSEAWLKAEAAAKKATKMWKQNNKPRNEDDPFFKNKKETRTNLRKSIKTFTNSKSIEEINIVMEANFRNPKLFSKLVKKKRKNDQGYTAMINVNDKEYRGDAQVLSGFLAAVAALYGTMSVRRSVGLSVGLSVRSSLEICLSASILVHRQ